MYRVVQVIDSLQVGGMESMAVNIANGLADHGVVSYLCSTRASGPLEQRLSGRVTHLKLSRKRAIDFSELSVFVRFLREERIGIIHAHGTSLFFSALARHFAPGSRVLWHDHYGRYATERRPVWLYRLGVRRAAGVVSASEQLEKWTRNRLKVDAKRVWYVPNFVVVPSTSAQRSTLPGVEGKRIVCVANLRPEKDHLTLIDAMALVVSTEPDAMLLLVGTDGDRKHMEGIRARIQHHGLSKSIHLLGSRGVVWPILHGCDIGVLSSMSEGLPLALLEYGMAGLPAVATRVGQVPEVMDEGRVGILIPPGSAEALSSGLLQLLRSARERLRLGTDFQSHVRAKYGEGSVIAQVLSIYSRIMTPGAREQGERAATSGRHDDS